MQQVIRLACLAVSVGALATTGVVSAASSNSSKVTLAGSIPSWARAQNLVGATDPTTNVGFRVYFGWTSPDAAVALAQSVSDPKSPGYRQYLTPNQFRAQFAPRANDVAQVKNWLTQNGFTVDYIPKNNHYIVAEGTVAQVQSAFGVQVNDYSVQGLTVHSPASELSIPSAFAGLIKDVLGIDEGAAFVQTYNRADTNAPPPAGFRNAPPLSAYYGELPSPYAFPTGFTDLSGAAPWSVRGYTPDQIKGAYGLSHYSYDGSGQTVAVIDAYASPTILADVNQWSKNRGLPTMNPSQLVQVVPPGVYRRPENRKQDPQGWSGEETLDIEAVHGMAPGAKIVYVGAPNNYQDLDAAMNHVVDEGLAQIVTNSYGFSTELLHPGFVKPLEDTFIQAAIEGIGVYFSSGDNGDESSLHGTPTPDWPASSPWVTAVGGTALGVDANNHRKLETGWGTSSYSCNTVTLVCTSTGWLYGAGGGVSRLFAEPSYQQAAGLALTGRGVPDVAALADPQSGFLEGQTQTFPDGVYYDEYRIGGTSLASPIFAGIMALADQAAGTPHGFANPLFYANPAAFYDVLPVKTAVARRNYVDGVDASAGTVDKLRTLDDYSGSMSQHTGPGWDNVTGLGTPGSSFLTLLGK